MSLVRIDPDVLGGKPCFTGTRVPVKALFDSLEHNRTIEYFLEGFPSVSREQVPAVLAVAREHITASAGSSAEAAA